MKKSTSRTTQPIRSPAQRHAMDKYFMSHNPRNRVMFALGIYTGRRISDILNLDVRDVAEIDRRGRLCIRERLELQEVKTGKFVDILIHPKLKRILNKYLKQRRKECETLGALLNEPLLKSQKPRHDGQYRITRRHALRILSECASACGVEGRVGTHSLRKTFGYRLYNNKTSIETIQQALNHSSPEVTLSYIGITRDDFDEAILSLD